jgi:hypothetical protein
MPSLPPLMISSPRIPGMAPTLSSVGWMSASVLTRLAARVAAASARAVSAEKTVARSHLPKLRLCPMVPEEEQTPRGVRSGSILKASFPDRGLSPAYRPMTRGDSSFMKISPPFSTIDSRAPAARAARPAASAKAPATAAMGPTPVAREARCMARASGGTVPEPGDKGMELSGKGSGNGTRESRKAGFNRRYRSRALRPARMARVAAS